MDKSKWEYKKLTDVCSILYGYPFDSKCFNDNNQGRPLIRIRDVVRGFTETYTTEKCPDEYIISEGDLLIGMDGEFNISAWKSVPALLNQRVCKIKADDKNIIDGFMYYLMKTKLKEIESETAFVTVKHLSAKVLNKVNVQLPSIADQQRIVAELDCLNEMIALKQEQLKEFDKLAQSIFYDMFESVEKQVPASYYIESLSGGKSLAGEAECINKVLKTGAVTYDYFREEEVKNLPLEYEPMPEHLLKDGDLLISRMNTLEYVGAIAYVWKAPQNTYLPDRLWRAKVKDNANPIYLWYSLKQDKAKEQIRAKASGTSGSMKNISMPKFLNTIIKEVPLALQQQFAEKIQAIEAQKELVKKSIAETQQLLDSRMDYYFD